MTEDLHQLLLQGESARVEFKRSLADERRIIETIAAMATLGGGTLLIGVGDEGDIIGVELGAGAQERLVQRVLAQTDPKVYVDLHELDVDDKHILRIDVLPGDGPHLAYGRAFFRSGPATVAMARDEYERRLLDRMRAGGGFERRADPASSLEDIDYERLHRFLAGARVPALLAGEEPTSALRRLRLLDDGRLTNAGALLFGRWPQGGLPQAVIRARVQRGILSDARSIEGTLDAQIEEAAHFAERNLRQVELREDLRRVTRPELPSSAIREAIANAVAHRDYRSSAPTQLVLDDDRLTIWNPGQLPAPLTPAALRDIHPSIPPNPLTARALYLMGYIEEWGTGTNRIIQTLADNGNPPPIFEEDSAGLRVTLPLIHGQSGLLNPRQTRFLALVGRGDLVTTADYGRSHGVASRTALADLQELERLGLVTREGRGKALRWRRR